MQRYVSGACGLWQVAVGQSQLLVPPDTLRLSYTHFAAWLQAHKHPDFAGIDLVVCILRAGGLRKVQPRGTVPGLLRVLAWRSPC